MFNFLVNTFINAAKPVSKECYKSGKTVTLTLPSDLWMDLISLYSSDENPFTILEMYPGTCFHFMSLIYTAHPTLLLASLCLQCVYRCIGEAYEGKTFCLILFNFLGDKRSKLLVKILCKFVDTVDAEDSLKIHQEYSKSSSTKSSKKKVYSSPYFLTFQKATPEPSPSKSPPKHNKKKRSIDVDSESKSHSSKKSKKNSKKKEESSESDDSSEEGVSSDE